MMSLAWMDEALCKNYSTSLFYPEETGQKGRAAAEAARSVCARCPVLTQCGEWADLTDEPHGVWAGELRHGRARTAVLCGTEGGAQTHRRRGETPCDACAQAARRASNIRGAKARALKASRRVNA